MRGFTGEAASLGAAFTWAAATFLYERHGSHLSAASLNLLRTSISSIVFVALTLTSGAAWPDPMTTGLLALSGLLTFGLSDSLFFAALSRIGGQATAIPQCSVPVVVAAMAWIMWGEALTMLQMIGLSLTLVAVTVVILQPGRQSVCANPSTSCMVDRKQVVGSLFAGLSALLQALGVVILKRALVGVDIMAAMVIRVVPTAAAMAAWRACHREKRRPRGTQLRWLIAAILLGTVVGTLLQSYGLQHASTGVCTVLNATYPLWLIPIGLVAGCKADRSTIAPAMAALAGVILVCA